MAQRQKKKPWDDLPVTTAEPRAMIGETPVFCSFDELKPIGEVTPNPRNPNHHPKSQIELLAKVIRGQGWRAPITVSRRSGLIVKGHGRLEAAYLLELPEVPVDFQDYASEAEETADLLADNKIAELAKTDDTALANLLGEMARSDGGAELMAYTGYSDNELSAMFVKEDKPDESNPDGFIDVPEHPIARRGDVWLMGPHRLVCGSATNPQDVARAMNRRKAQLIWTDPPYGVSYVSQSGKFDMIVNDDLVGDKLINNLLLPAFANMRACAHEDAAFYIWHASSSRKEFDAALFAAGLQENQYIIWFKDGFVLGHGDYQWAHEPCYYASKVGQSPAFYGDRAQPTVWKVTTKAADRASTVVAGGITLTDGAGGSIHIQERAPKGKKPRSIRLQEGETVELLNESAASTLWVVKRDTNTQHPTQKPVELATRAIENSTQDGDLCADFFTGSGPLLRGCELTGRKFAGTEWEPKYVDVAVQSWIEMTGREMAVYVERDGRKLSYAQAKAERFKPQDGENG